MKGPLSPLVHLEVDHQASQPRVMTAKSSVDPFPVAGSILVWTFGSFKSSTFPLSNQDCIILVYGNSVGLSTGRFKSPMSKHSSSHAFICSIFSSNLTWTFAVCTTVGLQLRYAPKIWSVCSVLILMWIISRSISDSSSGAFATRLIHFACT